MALRVGSSSLNYQMAYTHVVMTLQHRDKLQQGVTLSKATGEWFLPCGAQQAQSGTVLMLNIFKLPEDAMESHVSVTVTMRASPKDAGGGVYKVLPISFITEHTYTQNHCAFNPRTEETETGTGRVWVPSVWWESCLIRETPSQGKACLKKPTQTAPSSGAQCCCVILVCTCTHLCACVHEHVHSCTYQFKSPFETTCGQPSSLQSGHHQV